MIHVQIEDGLSYKNGQKIKHDNLEIADQASERAVLWKQNVLNNASIDNVLVSLIFSDREFKSLGALMAKAWSTLVTGLEPWTTRVCERISRHDLEVMQSVI